MWATLHDRANMVTLLLDRGGSIDSADKVGELLKISCRVEYI